METKALLAIGCACAAAAQCASAQQRKPNVIYIMCDDMGYGDLACYGQPYISTPHIDSMAAQGTLFTQAYAGSPVSAPSRSTLMTGQHTGHCEVRGNKEYWPGAPMVTYGVCQEYSVSGQHPYSPDHIILPEIMKDNGYTTGMFGKWAGGYEGSCSTPDKRGIDEFFGYICQYQAHLYYPNFLNSYSRSRGDTAVSRVILEENVLHPMFGEGYDDRTQYSADMIHQAALRWMGGQDGSQPFFAMLTYTLPHAELAQPNDSILAGYKKKFFNDHTWGGQEGSRYNPVEHTHAHFAAMITRLDAYVGEIIAKIDEMGLADNTLIIFTSDNGPHEEGGADPAFFGRDGKLRGLKRECHEGGIRVPFIARWSGKVPAGAVSDHQLAFYDIIPTLCELIGVDNLAERYGSPEADHDFDGISFLPALLGQQGQREHEFLYWEFHETDQMAVRSGDWKLIVKRGKPELYNLASDLHEDTDVAADNPEIVAAMVEIIMREHTPSPYFPVTLPRQATQ